MVPNRKKSVINGHHHDLASVRQITTDMFQLSLQQPCPLLLQCAITYQTQHSMCTHDYEHVVVYLFSRALHPSKAFRFFGYVRVP